MKGRGIEDICKNGTRDAGEAAAAAEEKQGKGER